MATLANNRVYAFRKCCSCDTRGHGQRQAQRSTRTGDTQEVYHKGLLRTTSPQSVHLCKPVQSVRRMGCVSQLVKKVGNARSGQSTGIQPRSLCHCSATQISSVIASPCSRVTQCPDCGVASTPFVIHFLSDQLLLFALVRVRLLFCFGAAALLRCAVTVLLRCRTPTKQSLPRKHRQLLSSTNKFLRAAVLFFGSV